MTDRIGQTLRRLRQERGYSLRQIALATGIDQGGLSKRELGIFRIKPHERALFAKALNMTLEDFDAEWSGNVSPNGPHRGIPILQNVPKTGTPKDAGPTTEEPPMADRDMNTQDARLFALRVVGDSMHPSLNDGDLMICLPTESVTEYKPTLDGELVAATFSEDSSRPNATFFARLFVEPNNKLRFVRDNPMFPSVTVSRSEVVGMARVVQRRTNTF